MAIERERRVVPMAVQFRMHWLRALMAAFMAVGLSAAVLGAEGVKPAGPASAMPTAGGESAAGVERPLPAGAVMRLGTTRLRHSGSVTAVAFTPDSKWLVSSSTSDQVRIWDVSTGRQVRAIGERGEGVLALALSRDGSRLFTGGPDIRVWDMTTGSLLMSAPRDKEAVGCLALSPDGRTLASASRFWGGGMHLWKVQEGMEEIESPLWAPGVTCLALSPDGKQLAVGDGEGTVRIWEMGSDKEPLAMAGYRERVAAIAFAPDGKALATAGSSETGEVKLWDRATGLKLLEFKTGAQDEEWPPTRGIEAIAFSPDGRVLGSVGADGSVLFWDPASGRRIRTLQTAQGARAPYQAIAFSPNGRVLATAGAGNIVRLWDVGTGTPIFKEPDGHVGHVICVAVSPEGGLIASGGGESKVQLWDGATGRHVSTLEGPEGTVYAVAFSADGKLLASGGPDGVVRIWDPFSGKDVRTLKGEARSWVRGIVLSPDGSLLAALCPAEDSPYTPGPTFTVRVWRVGTGDELLKLGPIEGSGRLMAFSADGKALACEGPKGTVHSWDLPAGAERPVFELPGEAPWHEIGLSPDARFLVEEDPANGVIRLWDLTNSRMMKTIPIPGEYVRYAVFSADSALVAVSSNTRVRGTAPAAPFVSPLRVFETATGREIAKFDTKDEGMVMSLAFLPDGKRLVTGMANSTILVWALGLTK